MAKIAIPRSRPLHEAVVDRLRDMVLDGDLAVGERLHDANLAEMLGVSRTPIREAIKLLASEGVVDLLPGRGARVAACSLDDLIALVEVIAGLERHACELAAERMTARDFKRVRRLHAEMAVFHRGNRRHDYSRLNHEIHISLPLPATSLLLRRMPVSSLGRAGAATAPLSRRSAGLRQWPSTAC